MQCLSKTTQTLVALSILLASTIMPGRLLPIVKAFESTGTLDPSFGVGGKVITNLGISDSEGAQAIALSRDGIVAVGHVYVDFALTRYDGSGTLDPRFGAGGKVTTDFGSAYDAAYSVVMDRNKIVVVGGTGTSAWPRGDFALARYNSDGTLDPRFGTGGKVTTDFGTIWDTAYSVVMDRTKIVVAGTGGSDFALARYNSDGTLDSRFGAGGKVTTDFGSANDTAYSVVMDRNKIVVAGAAGGNFVLARYNSDGTLDTSFGNGGKVITDFGSTYDLAYSIALQSDGKIVAAGTAGFDFALARYDSNGVLDSSFGAGGKVTTDFGSAYDAAYSIALQPDGKIVAGGDTSVDFYTDYNFALARYNSDGMLDLNFGTGGKVTTDFGGSYPSNDGVRSIAVQSDGEIVAAGFAYFGGKYNFALARYQ